MLFRSVLTMKQTLENNDPTQIVVDSAGKFLYAANTAFKGVLSYKIDQTDGTLANPTNVPAGEDPGALAIVKLQ